MKSLFLKEVETRLGEKERNRKKRNYLLTGIVHKPESGIESEVEAEAETQCEEAKSDGMRLESQSFKPNKVSVINLHE
jgi:hypothetical protein